MEGLEATELKMSEVRFENEKMRIDSQYFSRVALQTEQKIRSLPCGHTTFGEVASCFKKGIFDIKANTYTPRGIPFVRISNLQSGIINDSQIAYISEQVHEAESKTALRYGDLVLSKTAYAAAAFVNLEQCNVSQDTIAVQLKPQWKAKLSTAYISAFLNSHLGLILMNRQFQGNVQMHLSLSDGEKVKIPLLSKPCQEAIEDCFTESFKETEKAQNLYQSVESLLLNELNLRDWQPPQPLTYQETFKAAFSVGRLDAEHFQPQYASLIEHLQTYKGGSVQLGDLCPTPVNGVEVREYEDVGVPYLRVGDIQHFSINVEGLKYIAPKNAAREIEKVRLRVGDVLVSRSGSLGVIGVVEPHWSAAVISSHLIRVRIDEPGFDPYFVAAFLSSSVGRLQIQQHSNGGVQPEISQPSLKSIFIPNLDPTKQKEIRACILAGHTARQRAQILLEAAKRAVEIAIEEDESIALEYLHKKRVEGGTV